MASWHGTVVVGGLMVALVLAPLARAADARITFSGMILEPTCAIGASLASLAANASPGGATLSHGSCGQVQAGTDAGSRYELTEVTLLAQRQADPLLSYFTGYTQAAGTTARLVTQTYE